MTHQHDWQGALEAAKKLKYWAGWNKDGWNDEATATAQIEGEFSKVEAALQAAAGAQGDGDVADKWTKIDPYDRHQHTKKNIIDGDLNAAIHVMNIYFPDWNTAKDVRHVAIKTLIRAATSPQQAEVSVEEYTKQFCEWQLKKINLGLLEQTGHMDFIAEQFPAGLKIVRRG